MWLAPTLDAGTATGAFPKHAAPIAIWRTREVKNAIKTTILLAAMTGVILVSGDLLGGKVGLLVALGIATLVNFVAYWHSDKIVTDVQRPGGDEDRGTQAASTRP